MKNRILLVYNLLAYFFINLLLAPWTASNETPSLAIPKSLSFRMKAAFSSKFSNYIGWKIKF